MVELVEHLPPPENISQEWSFTAFPRNLVGTIGK
jgi:hypothetical protein